MATDGMPGTSPGTPRYRNVSGKPLNRRVVLKAAAGLGAVALTGTAATVGTSRSERVSAQEVITAEEMDTSTRAREWVAADHVGVDVEADRDGWVTFPAEFPFWAVGAGWSGDVGLWPIVEMQVSYDGVNWGDAWSLAARPDEFGRPTVDGRIFTVLAFADGQEFIRYRTVDNQGNLAPVDGLLVTYIDPTDGPWAEDRGDTMMVTSMTVANEDTDAPPSIITRAQWGANENYRYDSYGEIWPAEYETVEHAIVHHAAVNYGSDGYNAVRSIYYYHAVTQGWGDIGYNYLVDSTGKIFEGRVGGQNVIGGHSYEYAIGSSGICVIGDFRYQDATEAAKAALVHILAFVTRDLETYATKPFHEVPNLPTIAAHRDVNQTSCPGDFLYADLPEIRDLVAATLDAGTLDTGNPAGIVPGDQVKVQTDDGAPLNMRSGAGLSSPVNGSVPNESLVPVLDGPISDPNDNWYKVRYNNVEGWVSARYLIVTPPPPVVSDEDYAFGTNMRFTSSTNIRSKPSTSSSILGTVARNTWTFIMSGPIAADGYDWYQVRVPDTGDGWVIKDNVLPAPIDENPAAKFTVGDRVSAIRSTSVRARPGIAQTVASTAAAGTTMQISVEPIAVTGYIWYGVYSPSFGGGWVVENGLQEVAPPPTGDLVAGDTVRVTAALNMRSGPSTGNGIIATLPTGTTGKVLDGPRTGSGYTWYQIQTSYGSGWVVRNWIEKTTSAPPPEPEPTPAGYPAGTQLRVTVSLRLRSAPNTSGGIIATMPAGTTVTVTARPTASGGYTWYQLKTPYGAGYAASEYLETTGSTTPTDPPPPTSGKFQIGAAVRVTETLNIRSGPGTGNGIITTLPAGTTGTVLEGPRTGSGYTWWRIQTSRGTGWAAENWLAASSGSTPPPPSAAFAPGDQFQVTESLNMRSGAGTGNAIIATLPAGTTGTIAGGPRSANGYTWWQVRTTYGTGWVVQNWIRKV